MSTDSTETERDERVENQRRQGRRDLGIKVVAGLLRWRIQFVPLRQVDSLVRQFGNKLICESNRPALEDWGSDFCRTRCQQVAASGAALRKIAIRFMKNSSRFGCEDR